MYTVLNSSQEKNVILQVETGNSSKQYLSFFCTPVQHYFATIWIGTHPCGVVGIAMRQHWFIYGLSYALSVIKMFGLLFLLTLRLTPKKLLEILLCDGCDVGVRHQWYLRYFGGMGQWHLPFILPHLCLVQGNMYERSWGLQSNCDLLFNRWIMSGMVLLLIIIPKSASISEGK